MEASEDRRMLLFREVEDGVRIVWQRRSADIAPNPWKPAGKRFDLRESRVDRCKEYFAQSFSATFVPGPSFLDVGLGLWTQEEWRHA